MTSIWPNGSPWLSAEDDFKTAAVRLEQLLSEQGSSQQVLKRYREFATEASGYTAHSAWTASLSYLFPRLLAAANDLREGHATIMTDRTTTDFAGETAATLLSLVAHIVHVNLESAMQRTEGTYALLNRYNAEYETSTRAGGTLTFEDAQFLLSSTNQRNNGTCLSRQPSQENRLCIDYRLDARLDHWLLDEFQDTSDLQWDVLSNLAEEILQDDSGQRSFFIVGDVKQAIYGWRGGNPRLFGMLLDLYEEVIETKTLTASQRSCPAIIKMVNDTFGELPSNKLPPGAIASWTRFWEPHESAERPARFNGIATLLEPPCDGGDYKPTAEDRYRIVAGLLNEIEPLKRGLSVAVLVRSNGDGKAVVDYLRSACPGLPVVHEGRAAIVDNPVVSLMLSLVKFAAHPGDMYAWRHLQMSPLATTLDLRHHTRDSL
ncbi:UvrD-helicase domain-containing protein, partial [Candidatus Bipolaricaulota bacterium]|nr:UvrD-helicase domain-containing protein [Candidatus Bipolaricaulota bacterium]